MSGFKVSIVNGQVNVLCEEDVPETDIIDLLSFDETQMEDLYLTHAAVQARWEQVAINLRNNYEVFSEEFERLWWAHNKRYAKLALEGYGENKPTVDAIKDTAILVYSMHTSDSERNKYCDLALRVATKRDQEKIESREQFFSEMFKFILNEPKWYFETLVHTVKSMEKQYLTAANIAKRLDNRSFHMKELSDLMRAKQSNIGPMSYGEQKREKRLMDSLSGKV